MFIAIVTISLLSFFCFVGYMVYKTLVNPISLYNLSWILCVGCNSILIAKYGTDFVSSEIYIGVLLSCFLLTATCILYSSKYKKNIAVYDMLATDTYELNFKFILILNIIAIISNIPTMLESIEIILTKGIYYARMEQVVGTGIAFILKDMYKNIVVLPVFSATIYLSIDALVYNTTKYKYQLLTLSILELIMYTVAYFGRWLILQVFLFAVLLFLFRFKQSKVDFSVKEKKRLKSLKKIGVFLGILMIISLVAITSQRTMGDDGSILYTVTLYFGGSLKYCDLGIQEIKENAHILYGAGLFPAIWDYPLLIMQKLANLDFLRPQEILYLYSAPIKSIGNGSVFTGFGTILMNMYLDGGFIGIIFDSIILGVISSSFYQKMTVDYNIRKRLCGFLSLLIMALVIIQWDGNRIATLMVFVYFFLFTKKKSNRYRVE